MMINAITCRLRRPPGHGATACLIACIAMPALAQEEVAPPGNGITDPGVHREVAVEKKVRQDSRPSWAFLGSRTYLGIEMVDLTDELRTHFEVPLDAGVMVSRVRDESPALTAGILVGDILTAIDGEPIKTPASLAMNVAHRENGETVTLEVWRDGQVENLEATLEERERTMVDIRRFHTERIGDDDTEIDVVELEHAGFADLTAHLGQLELDPEALERALERLDEVLAAPEWNRRVVRFREHEHALQERILELEERLEGLEAELKRLSGGD